MIYDCQKNLKAFLIFILFVNISIVKNTINPHSHVNNNCDILYIFKSHFKAAGQFKINVHVASFHFFSIVVVCRSPIWCTVILLQTRHLIDDAENNE